MPTVFKATNQRALLRVGAEMYFSDNATSLTNAIARGYAHLGNISGFNPNLSTQKVKHISSNRGVPKKDREDIIETQMEFKLKITEFSKENVRVLFGANDTTGFTQSSQSAANADTLAFGTTNAVIGYWYPITVSGAFVRELTVVTITALTEGTDFEVDYTNGLIRFLTAQSTNRVPVITAPAITSSDNTYYHGFTPLANVRREGWGYLLISDQDSQNKHPIWYPNFSCQVTLDSASEFNPNDFANMTLSVLVTSTVGTMYGRKSLANVS